MSLKELTEDGGEQSNGSLLELKTKAEKMARYGNLGLADSLQLIILAADRYSREDTQGKQLFGKKLKEDVYRNFQNIRDFYAEIPFDNLQEIEFYPLFVIMKLLPELNKSLNNVFEGKIGYGHDVGNIATALAQVQGLYLRNLMQLIGQIRSLPEGKNFQLEIKDRYRGVTHFL